GLDRSPVWILSIGDECQAHGRRHFVAAAGGPRGSGHARVDIYWSRPGGEERAHRQAVPQRPQPGRAASQGVSIRRRRGVHPPRGPARRSRAGQASKLAPGLLAELGQGVARPASARASGAGWRPHRSGRREPGPMSVDTFARTVWDYHRLNHALQPADGIIVLGSHDTRVAERGAEVFLGGWAPLIVFSGNLGALTSGMWQRPEAEIFAEGAAGKGVPRERTLM